MVSMNFRTRLWDWPQPEAGSCVAAAAAAGAASVAAGARRARLVRGAWPGLSGSEQMCSYTLVSACASVHVHRHVCKPANIESLQSEAPSQPQLVLDLQLCLNCCLLQACQNHPICFEQRTWH